MPVVFTFADEGFIKIFLGLMESSIKSPCIKVCKYDSEKNCMGCHRSMDEISNWIFYNDDEKKQVLKNAEVTEENTDRGKNEYDYYV